MSIRKNKSRLSHAVKRLLWCDFIWVTGKMGDFSSLQIDEIPVRLYVLIRRPHAL